MLVAQRAPGLHRQLRMPMLASDQGYPRVEPFPHETEDTGADHLVVSTPASVNLACV
jgi:hypothetical protein